MFPREKKIWRGAYPSVRPSVFRRWVFFLFARELATEMGVTDDYYTDGRVPLVRPSVIISPTKCIPVTDGISPSVKLFNGVVEPPTRPPHHGHDPHARQPSALSSPSFSSPVTAACRIYFCIQ
jgi:hypothetical protein